MSCALSEDRITAFLNSLTSFPFVFFSFLFFFTCFLHFPLRFFRLRQALVWWDSLTMIEKRNPQQKGQLVKKVESCLQGQATIFQGGGGSNDDSEVDDEKKEDK